MNVHDVSIIPNQFSPQKLNETEASIVAKVMSRGSEERGARTAVVLDENHNPVEFWYDGKQFVPAED